MRFKDGEFFSDSDELRSYLELASGGKNRIVCPEYDAFVLIGLDSFDGVVLALCRSYGTLNHRALVPVTHLITEGCFRAAVSSRLEGASVILQSIRTVSHAPIFIGPRPFPSEAILEMKGYERYRDSVQTDYPACLVKAYKDARNALAARYQGEVIWQDEATMRYPGFTKREFIDGSLRLMSEKQFRRHNVSHANEAFGALMLGKALRGLKDLRGAAPPQSPGPRQMPSALLDASSR